MVLVAGAVDVAVDQDDAVVLTVQLFVGPFLGDAGTVLRQAERTAARFVAAGVVEQAVGIGRPHGVDVVVRFVRMGPEHGARIGVEADDEFRGFGDEDAVAVVDDDGGRAIGSGFAEALARPHRLAGHLV